MKGCLYPLVKVRELFYTARGVKYFVENFFALAEQTRIVEKLESLLKTCDALEREIGAGSVLNGQLLQQVLREALAG